MTSAILMASLADPGWDKYLPDLFKQTMPPDQIVIVVDRAASDAEQTALRLQWPSVTFLFNGRNLGLTASLNRGLAIITADHVFRADDDDSYRQDRIERQLALFETSGADLVASWGEGIAPGANSEPYVISCPTTDGEIKAALLRRNVLIHASLAFRREKVAALGGYDETFVNAQDYALYLAAIRAGLHFAAVPEPLVRRSYTGNSITVERRYHQLMYSCAARIVHHAHAGDRKAFLKTLMDYARLAMIPLWARRARRRLHAMIGRGA